MVMKLRSCFAPSVNAIDQPAGGSLCTVHGAMGAGAPRSLANGANRKRASPVKVAETIPATRHYTGAGKDGAQASVAVRVRSLVAHFETITSTGPSNSSSPPSSPPHPYGHHAAAGVRNNVVVFESSAPLQQSHSQSDEAALDTLFTIQDEVDEGPWPPCIQHAATPVTTPAAAAVYSAAAAGNTPAGLPTVPASALPTDATQWPAGAVQPGKDVEGVQLRGAFAWAATNLPLAGAGPVIRLAAGLGTGMVLTGAVLAQVLTSPSRRPAPGQGSSPAPKYDGLSAAVNALQSASAAAANESWAVVPAHDPLRGFLSRSRVQGVARVGTRRARVATAWRASSTSTSSSSRSSASGPSTTNASPAQAMLSRAVAAATVAAASIAPAAAAAIAAATTPPAAASPPAPPPASPPASGAVPASPAPGAVPASPTPGAVPEPGTITRSHAPAGQAQLQASSRGSIGEVLMGWFSGVSKALEAVPKLTVPVLALPKVTVPVVTLPKVTVPVLALPKLQLPQRPMPPLPASVGKVCPIAQAKTDAIFAALTMPANPTALQPGFKPTVQLPPPPPGVSGQAAVDATFAVLTQPTNPAALQPGFKPSVTLPPPPPGTSGQAAIDAQFAALAMPKVHVEAAGVAAVMAASGRARHLARAKPTPAAVTAAVKAQAKQTQHAQQPGQGLGQARHAAAAAAVAAAANQRAAAARKTVVRRPGVGGEPLPRPMASVPMFMSVSNPDVHEPLVQLANSTHPDAVSSGMAAFMALSTPECQCVREAHPETFGLLASAVMMAAGFGVPAWRAMYLPRLSGLHAAAKADVPKLMQDLQAFTDLRPLYKLLAGRPVDEVLATLVALTQMVHAPEGKLPAFEVGPNGNVTQVSMEQVRAAMNSKMFM